MSEAVSGALADHPPDQPGIARFAADLPPVSRFITMGEGQTPLVPLPALAERVKVGELWAKLESLNPTGSYKDRVAAMSLSLALERRKAGWIATSSGNAGLAMAAYGRRARLPGFLCLAASAPLEKRAPLIPFGIELAAIGGVGRDATRSAENELFRQVSDAADRHNLFLGITAHAFNPDGMRGIDTIGYELAEQLPATTHLYVPTGGGGLLAATARGLRHRGRAVRIVACQPSGCAPIARYLDGEIAAPAVARSDSAISALQLPSPPDGQLAATAVTDSGGWGTHTSDEQIRSAQRLLAATEGVFGEPAAAAALSAVMSDAGRGKLDGDDIIVLLITGAGWKDLGSFSAAAADLPRLDVAAIPEAVGRWIGGSPC